MKAEDRDATWKARFEDAKQNALEAGPLASADRLQWLEEAVRIAFATGALKRADEPRQS